MSERKVRITRMEVEKTGSRGGRPWTLYNVECEAIDGQPLPEGRLTSFDSLTGEETVTVKPYTKDGQFLGHTLARAGGRRASAGDDSRIEALEERVSKLEARINALIKSIDTPLEVNVPS